MPLVIGGQSRLIGSAVLFHKGPSGYGEDSCQLTCLNSVLKINVGHLLNALCKGAVHSIRSLPQSRVIIRHVHETWFAVGSSPHLVRSTLIAAAFQRIKAVFGLL